jgi:predicted nucleic acid-binding protein
MLPSIKAVVTLDPQFVQAYYVAPGILIDSGTVAGVSARDAAARAKVGLELAAEGARNNPRSGLLLVSYAQLLFAANKDDARALQFAKSALAPGVIWRNDEEQWNMYAQVRGILRFHGLTQGAAQVQAAMDAISANPHATTETVTPE